MSRIAALAVALLAAGTASGKDPAPPPAPAFDKPVATSERSLGPAANVYPPALVRLKCSVYPDFVVVDVNDPSMMGDELTVRAAKAGADLARLCAPAAVSGQKSLEDAYGSLWGVSGPYVFIYAPDGFGLANEFQIYDSKTGKLVFKTEFAGDQPVTLKRAGPKLSLGFHTLLAKGDCAPAPGDAACWPALLKLNAVPPGVTIAPPVCAPKPQSHEEGAWQIAVPVTVDDAAAGKVRFASGRAFCGRTP